MSVETPSGKTTSGPDGAAIQAPWASALIRVFGSAAAAIPLLTGSLYLIGSIGYSQYLHFFALPEGYFPATFEQTLVNGYFVVFRVVASFPTERYDVILIWSFFFLVFLLTTQKYWPKARAQRLKKLLSRNPSLRRVLEAAAFSTAFASGMVMVSITASMALLAAPILGIRGGEAWALDVAKSAEPPCAVAGRCIAFGADKRGATGRLVASSPTHVALLVDDGRSVLIINQEGDVIASSTIRI